MKELPAILHPPSASAPAPRAAPAQDRPPQSPTPAVAPSRFADISQLLASIGKFTPAFCAELEGKFEAEMLDLDDLVAANARGSFAALDTLLLSVVPQAGARAKIITALIGS